ncbi:MAG: TadE family protein [Bdellovibrionota bacterium]
MIENAIAVPMFLIFLLITFDLLRLCYCRLSLQFALTDTVRRFSMNPGIDADADLQQRLARVGVNWQPATDSLTYCPRSIFYTNCPTGTQDAGHPREAMIFQADMKMNALLPGSQGSLLQAATVTLSTSVLSRNEPN